MFFKNDEKVLLEEIRGLNERLSEDRIYEKILTEIEHDDLDPVARVRAFEEAEGDTKKALALYPKHRARRIKDLAVEYEIWMKKEQQKKAEIKKNMEAEQLARKELSQRMNSGGSPPFWVRVKYASEFSSFYSEWCKRDPARKFIPKSSAWLAFLRSNGLID